MGYCIPSDEHVEQALRKVLTEFRTVLSQHQLQELVKDALGTKENSVGVSGHRLRTVALKSGFVDLEIHSREGDPDKPLSRCPVCGNQVKRVKNQTIWGGVVTLEFLCPVCGYWTGKKKRVPTRYVFHLKK